MKTKQVPDAELKVNCPNCSSTVYVLIDKLRRGEFIYCPRCQYKFDSASLMWKIPDIRQDIRNAVTDRLESDPDRYMKEFAPLWKRYTLALKICLVILAINILTIFIAPGTNYDYISFGAYLGSVCLVAFFAFNLHCPKCGWRIIWYHLGRVSFAMEGTCPNCGVRLKKRAVSVKTERIIKISILTMCAITALALLYMQLTQGICIKITR